MPLKGKVARHMGGEKGSSGSLILEKRLSLIRAEKKDISILKRAISALY